MIPSSPERTRQSDTSPVASTSALPYDSYSQLEAHNATAGYDERVDDDDLVFPHDVPQDTLAARRLKSSTARTTRRPAISRRRPSKGTTDNDDLNDASTRPLASPRTSPLQVRKSSGPMYIRAIPFPHASQNGSSQLSAKTIDGNATMPTSHSFGLFNPTSSASPITPTAPCFAEDDAVTPIAAPVRYNLYDRNAPAVPKLVDSFSALSAPEDLTPTTTAAVSPKRPVTMRMEMPPRTAIVTPSTAASSRRGDYVPNLPSPLSNSHTSDEDGILDRWEDSHDEASPATHPIPHYPFPISPSVSSKPINFASAPSTIPISAAGSQPPATSTIFYEALSVSRSPPTSIPRRLQTIPSPPARAERGRTSYLPNGHRDFPPQESSFPSHHWSAGSASSSRSTSLSRQDGAPLTPPDSNSTSGRQSILTSADAWQEVLQPRLSYSNMEYNAPSGSNLIAATAKLSLTSDDRSSVKDETPAARRQSMPLGQTTSRSDTPTDAELHSKRVKNGDLMAGSGGGHFGPATREILASTIARFVHQVPLSVEDDSISLVEYGSMSSRSASLFPAVISSLATRHEDLQTEDTLASAPQEHDDDGISFTVTHCDTPEADFRPLVQLLEKSSDSYLNAHWLADHRPSLENRVFSSFAMRPFGSKVLPRNSVSFGFSAMSLHWLSTDRKYRMAPATIAHGELMAFLSARATEFRVGGVLALAYIARSEDRAIGGLNRGPSAAASLGAPRPLLQGHSSSPDKVPSADLSSNDKDKSPSPPSPSHSPEVTRPSLRERSASTPLVPSIRKDIWTMFLNILGKAIQRLVSTQLLKPAVARQLLALPIHPRTPKQTKAALRAMQHAWAVESEEMIKLSHPAWAGLEHQTVSPASYADQTIQLIKVFWESEMRQILRENLLSRAASEFTLDCLWNVVKEKLDEEGPQPLELEVQITVLRRKPEA